MLRLTVRLIPLLVLFVASSHVTKADSFQITFTGNASGTGQFTTDGVCAMCFPTAGLLTWVVNIGPDSGPNAFDIVDDGPATATITYDRATNSFSSIGTFYSENNDFFILFPDKSWDLSTLNGDFFGTYAVTPAGVPEPATPALLLLAAIVLAGTMAWRHNAATNAL